MRARALAMSALLISGIAVLPELAGAETPAAPLFPQAFVVEHRARERQSDGSLIESEKVRTTYGGSWLVSERPDGNRTIVDFSRREVTEVRPSAGTYWVLTFGQMTDLKARLAGAERRTPAKKAAVVTSPVEIRVEELSDGAAPGRRSAVLDGLPGPTKRLRASAGERAAEVWVDPSMKMSTAALDALEEFSRAVSGPRAGDGPSGSDLIAAARRKAAGAFVVRSVRSTGRGGEVEEFVEKLTRASSVPRNLVVPEEGLRRVPSPLEIVVSFAEEEAARAAVGGRK